MAAEQRAAPEPQETGGRLEEVGGVLRREDFALVHAPQMHAVLARSALADWEGFARTWDDLGVEA